VNSKKDAATRRSELLVQIQDLLKYCADNVPTLIRDKFGFSVLLETLLYVEGDKSSVVESIIKLIKSSNEKNADHVMSHPVASRFIKILIVRNFSYQENDSEVFFAKKVLNALGNNLTKWATTDYATAVIVALLKNEKTSNELKKTLKSKKGQLEKVTEVRGTQTIISILNE